MDLKFVPFFVFFICGGFVGAQLNYNEISLDKSTSVFAAKIIKELSNKKPDENLLVSPVSIQLILGLLKIGAEGITARELSEVLVVPENNNKLKDHLFKLQQSFVRNDYVTPSKEPNITIANAIYVRQDVRISEPFHQAAKKHLQVDVRPLQPYNRNLTIVEEINNWVSNATHEQINKVLEDSDVTADTVMLLINTLHFKGKWRDNGFNISDTKPEPFYFDSTRFRDIPTMRQTDYFLFGRYNQLNITYLELPYSGQKTEDTGDYVFAIYLPDTFENGTAFLNDNIEYLLTNPPEIANFEQVDVHIPRFKITSNNKLKEILENLGLKHAFSNAQFPELTIDKKSVQVTSVIHNTAIDVSEEGTEASAVTVVGVDDRIFSQPLPFHANRPFLFVLKQKSTNIILFVGHFKNVKQ